MCWNPKHYLFSKTIFIRKYPTPVTFFCSKSLYPSVAAAMQSVALAKQCAPKAQNNTHWYIFLNAMELDFASDTVSSTPHLHRSSPLKPECAILRRLGRAFWSGGMVRMKIPRLYQEYSSLLHSHSPFSSPIKLPTAQSSAGETWKSSLQDDYSFSKVTLTYIDKEGNKLKNKNIIAVPLQKLESDILNGTVILLLGIKEGETYWPRECLVRWSPANPFCHGKVKHWWKSWTTLIPAPATGPFKSSRSLLFTMKNWRSLKSFEKLGIIRSVLLTTQNK